MTASPVGGFMTFGMVKMSSDPFNGKVGSNKCRALVSDETNDQNEAVRVPSVKLT